MSSIAAFLRLPKARVAGGDLLAAGGKRFDYAWSGYAAADLLSYLEEKGLPVGDANVDTLSFVLTAEHRAYLHLLDPAAFDADEFRAYIEDDSFEEAGEMAAETLQLLSEQVSTLGEDEALVVLVY